MNKQAVFLLTLCWAIVYSKNESNIQKVNSRRMSEIEANMSNFSENEKGFVNDEKVKRNHSTMNSYEKSDKNLLFTFSKNNPELDWKSALKMITNNFEEQKDMDIDFMTEKLEKTTNSIQWLMDLYDPLRWRKIPGNLHENCRTDMEWFLGALKKGKVWAAKMSDASGRYASQFFFGNGFWLGSSNLCSELNSTKEEATDVANEKPPFPVKFYVARMFLQMPKQFDVRERQLFLGLCLPVTCNVTSVTSMLKTIAHRVESEGNINHRSSGPKILIFAVKPVPSSDYNLLQDKKFFILVGVGAVIIFLMICSGFYEYGNITNMDESNFCNTSTNNVENCQYMENLPQDHKIYIHNHCNKQIFSKISNDNESNVRLERVKKEDLWLRCLLAFNPIINGSKIINTDPPARDSLNCLHGLRVFSLGWVVLVHTYLQVFSIADNKTLRTVTERNVMFQTISNATFSVDTFFFISGLLVTILFFRSMNNMKNENRSFLATSLTKFMIMIVYRFIRLTPAYLFVLGMNEIAIKYALSKTVFSPGIIDHLTCEKFWWRNALYLNSLFPRTEMCMLWSWYMANDTQFYVLGIFLLLLSIKYLKAVAIIVFLLIVSSWFTTFSIAYSNDYIARIQEPFALFDELYDKPWLRAGPYFIGTVTGYILFKSKCKVYIPNYLKFLCWIISIMIMLSVVYGLYPGNLSILTSSIYASLGHTAWAMAIAFIVIQCCTGSAPIIDSLLSIRLMHPLSRLTYCAYLVHPVIMMITSTQMDGPFHLHNGLVLIIYFGNLVASYLLSFCVSIALEAPLVNLLKIAFTSKKRIK
ncbi:nose resistant to fluoxetine protein 6-like [Leptopilina boulardi]|uniref:nose resistant to fluoxetine protein 6-like n=1 Tax=Leptopilina boulardi TaxID=63433 RepID=UPI0021F57321|nr:nose resistant to fluoxetine protein 6-like [Leptopilina boulardi]XP_051166893.1 nose resistant to fluoxetine protein 6-like [Leptopilina boulardi]